MDPSVILALIAELYQRVAVLTQENDALRQQVAQEPSGPPEPTT